MKLNTALETLPKIVKIREGRFTGKIMSAIAFGAMCILSGVWYASGFAVVFYVFKLMFVRFRKDLDTDCPVFKKLKSPHGCHRGGASDFGPENTLYNYIRCVRELNTNILEIDLRLSKDKQIVLMHDDFVDRTTNGTGAVSNFTVSQLKELNAAVNYPSLSGKGITIPTLEEVLTEFKNDDFIYFFDVKDSGVVPLLPEIIEKWNLEERLILGAVSPSVNKLLRLFPSKIPVCPDFSSVLQYLVAYALGLDWLYIGRHAIFGGALWPGTNRIFTKGMIQSWKERNLKVIMFGPLLDLAENQKKWLEYGCDVILTDRPDVLSELLGESEKSGINTNPTEGTSLLDEE